MPPVEAEEPSLAVHQAHVRVRYAETDQMGVAYHANYLVWMEIGRVEFCRARGVRYRDLEENEGVLLAVVEAQCQFHAPARYDDELEVRTRIVSARPRMVHFGYEIFLAGGDRKLASGSTKHLFCNSDLRPVRLPPQYYKLFGIEERRAAQSAQS